jgi:adenosylcobinamide kinase/adenosylcobinamide-phosphate guanylyltransferase
MHLNAHAPEQESEVVIASTPASPRRTLVIGGARSGKSLTAERLLAAEPSVVYVATAQHDAADTEWKARVAAHRARRPSSWSTVETPDLAALLRDHDAGDAPLLIDCLTLWLTHVMDAAGTWSAVSADAAADRACAAAVDELIAAWRGTRGRVVAVSNDVGSGVVPEYPSGRRFRDELGTLNARLAAESDEVLFVEVGIPRSLRNASQAAR